MSLPKALSGFGQYPQFVNWNLVQVEGSPKPAKVPVDATGRKIDPHNPTNWMTAEQAYTQAAAFGYGVGFVFTADDPFFFIDIDNCLTEAGQWTDFAQQTCAAFPGAAVEVSQSGKGLHIFGCGTVPPGYKTRNHQGLEVYTHKRFVALSGRDVSGDVWLDWTGQLAQFVPAHLEPQLTEVATVDGNWTTVPAEGYTGPADDDELIRKMLAAGGGPNQVFSKSCPISALWNGDAAVIGQYFPDPEQGRAFDASSADLALANHLAFWTGRDCARIERLLRRSGLVRDKWDRHKTYLRDMTILKVVRQCNAIYSHEALIAQPDGSAIPPIKDERILDFPTPVDPFGDFPIPDIPPGVLPDVIEKFSIAESNLIGADLGGIALSAIVTCASAIKDEIQVQVKQNDEGWCESARLWGVLVGAPSTKKSPAVNTATHPIKRLAKRQIAEFTSAQTTYEMMADKENAIEPFPPGRLYVQDATIEAMQPILAENQNGILVIRDELSAWIGGMEKYSAGKGAAVDRGFWLEGWNGGPYTVDRIGRGSTYIPNLSMSLIGGIQPDVLQRDIKTMNHDGLLQRFIPVILKHATMGSDIASNAQIRNYYYQVVTNLFGLHQPENGPLRFDDGAQAVRRVFSEYAHDLATLDELGKHFSAWAGKLDGMFARICLTFHCIELSSGLPTATIPPIIPARIARMVDRLFREYLIPHGLHFYCNVLADGDSLPHVRQIAGLILSKGWSRIRPSDLTQNYRPAKSMTSRDMEQVLDKLVSFGWLEPEHRHSGSKKSWLVNPQVHEKFKKQANLERDERTAKRAILLKNITGAS
tara:strand:- start:3774 stop:6221 length:2448 start_codon:yes stop_codon:yes gene_type:complete